MKFLLFLTVALLAGCQTPTQQQALATTAAGNAYATYVLDHNGTPSVKALTDLAAALPLIPVGKVSAFQSGVINQELQTVQTTLTSSGAASPTSAQNQLLSQVGSLISLVSNAQAAGSGPETAEQGILVANATDVAGGITNAISFWQGQQSAK